MADTFNPVLTTDDGYYAEWEEWDGGEYIAYRYGPYPTADMAREVERVGHPL